MDNAKRGDGGSPTACLPVLSRRRPDLGAGL